MTPDGVSEGGHAFVSAAGAYPGRHFPKVSSGSKLSRQAVRASVCLRIFRRTEDLACNCSPSARPTFCWCKRMAGSLTKPSAGASITLTRAIRNG